MIPKAMETTRTEVIDDPQRAWSGWIGESSTVKRDGEMDVVVSTMEGL